MLCPDAFFFHRWVCPAPSHPGGKLVAVDLRAGDILWDVPLAPFVI